MGELMALAQSLGVGESVKSMGGIRLDQMPQVIADADLGVVPKRADSFGNEAYSTKIMEFMSQGIPVVVSGRRSILTTIKKERLIFLNLAIVMIWPGQCSRCFMTNNFENP